METYRDSDQTKPAMRHPAKGDRALLQTTLGMKEYKILAVTDAGNVRAQPAEYFFAGIGEEWMSREDFTRKLVEYL